MNILKPTWLEEKPIDYELKKYIFLSAYGRFEDKISNNQLFSTLKEIEFHLDKLYRLKYQKDELDESRKVIVGIDLDLMELEYDYKEEVNEIHDFYMATDFAIGKLEILYKKLRNRWRYISNKIIITEIPDKKPTKNKGIIFLGDGESIKLYSYVKPSKMNSDWESLVLNEFGEIKNETNNIAEFISKSESISDDNRFWRFDTKYLDSNFIPYEDCILPVVTYNLFNKLKFN